MLFSCPPESTSIATTEHWFTPDTLTLTDTPSPCTEPTHKTPWPTLKPLCTDTPWLSLSDSPLHSIRLSLPWGPEVPECMCLPVSPDPLNVYMSPSPGPAPPQTLASAKEENVEIHQTLDQTLLELNNL
ncbi:hypothetical protein H8959_012146 [Pygathrix nigripes]